MQIIVLQGMPNTGKTKTLNLVFDIMVLNGGGVSTNRQVLGNPSQNDFSDIVKWNNQKVAFFTMGDYSTYLAKAIYDFNRQNCDILVCALSINTVKKRANNALNKFNATRITKTVAPNQNAELAVNTADAQTISNLI